MRLITKQGFEALQVKLKQFREEAIEITKRVQEARSDSTEMAENKELIDALEDQSNMDKKIIDLEEKIKTIKVIDIENYNPENKNIVNFGAKVTIFDCDLKKEFRYQIVGPDEIDTLNKELIKISYLSPVGAALMKKSLNEEVDVIIPNGEKLFEIIKIDYY